MLICILIINANIIFSTNRMELKRGQEIELKIDDYAYGGKGISRTNTETGAYVIFVQNALPGQLVKAKVLNFGNVKF